MRLTLSHRQDPGVEEPLVQEDIPAEQGFMMATYGQDLAIKGSVRAAAEKPPFSVATLRKAIPEHCWNRSLLYSLAYLFADLTCIAALASGTALIDCAVVPRWLAWGLLWPLYWFLQVHTLKLSADSFAVSAKQLQVESSAYAYVGCRCYWRLGHSP